MKNLMMIAVLAVLAVALSACEFEQSQENKDTQAVSRQQAQYAKAQPVPTFDHSLERSLLIKLYELRNRKVATHSVWRSNYGLVEGDCPSMGYGLPYDTSLTNPFMAVDEDSEGWNKAALVAVGQPEPNGIFASTNTSATWVMCVDTAGTLGPHYVESKVTVYPYPVSVDYATNRVTRNGKATVTMTRE
jgi:hypothetical protein